MGYVSRLNYKIIFHLMGLLLLVNGGFMWIASIFSFVYDDGVGMQIIWAGLECRTTSRRIHSRYGCFYCGNWK